MKTTYKRELNRILLTNGIISKSIEQMMLKRDCDSHGASYLEGFFSALVLGFSNYDNYPYEGETFAYLELEPLIIKELKIVVSELGMNPDIIRPVSDIVKNKH